MGKSKSYVKAATKFRELGSAQGSGTRQAFASHGTGKGGSPKPADHGTAKGGIGNKCK